jgi:hypothetical protein
VSECVEPAASNPLVIPIADAVSGNLKDKLDVYTHTVVEDDRLVAEQLGQVGAEKPSQRAKAWRFSRLVGCGGWI